MALDQAKSQLEAEGRHRGDSEYKDCKFCLQACGESLGADRGTEYWYWHGVESLTSCWPQGARKGNSVTRPAGTTNEEGGGLGLEHTGVGLRVDGGGVGKFRVTRFAY